MERQGVSSVLLGFCSVFLLSSLRMSFSSPSFLWLVLWLLFAGFSLSLILFVFLFSLTFVYFIFFSFSPCVRSLFSPSLFFYFFCLVFIPSVLGFYSLFRLSLRIFPLIAFIVVFPLASFLANFPFFHFLVIVPSSFFFLLLFLLSSFLSVISFFLFLAIIPPILFPGASP